jgi:hypothetical protein
LPRPIKTGNKSNKSQKFQKIFILKNTIELKKKAKEYFLSRNNKVRFENLKYNLTDLFQNPPLFDEPPLSYSTEELIPDQNDKKHVKDSELHVLNHKLLIKNAQKRSQNSWGRISQMVMSSSDPRMKYIKNYEETQNKLSTLPHAPFLFERKYVLVEDEKTNKTPESRM